MEVVLVGIALVVAFCVFVYKMDKASDRAYKERAKAREDAFYKEQEGKPTMCLAVYTYDGTVFRSSGFEPYYKSYGSGSFGFVAKSSSQEHAQAFAERIVKDGRYFHNESGTMIPLRDIQRVKIEAVKV